MHIEEVLWSSPGIADQAHAVLQEAYAQEALLLQVDDFPPLARTLADLLAAPTRGLGAYEGTRLVGVLEFVSQPDRIRILSLVVLPSAQRRGIGSGLLRASINVAAGRPLEVQTAMKNAPALALYRQHGFARVATVRLQTGLELVQLRSNG